MCPGGTVAAFGSSRAAEALRGPDRSESACKGRVSLEPGDQVTLPCLLSTAICRCPSPLPVLCTHRQWLSSAKCTSSFPSKLQPPLLGSETGQVERLCQPCHWAFSCCGTLLGSKTNNSTVPSCLTRMTAWPCFSHAIAH